MPDEIHIIYNPNSTGPSRALAEELAAELPNAGINCPVKLQATAHAGHAAELAERLATKDGRRLIVSSSGDGGYNEVISGVMRAQAQGRTAMVAVLPAGNANDHSRTVQHRPLAEAIGEGKPHALDVLVCTVTAPKGGAKTVYYAHSYIGLGLTPVIAAELNRETLNALRETLIVLRSFFRLRPVSIRLDGQVKRFDSLIIGNINQMAKVLTVSRQGRPDDGLFEVTTLPYRSKWRLIMRLLRAAGRGLSADRRASSFAFETLKATPLQLDGEVVTLPAGASVAITIAPGAVQTFI